MKNDHFIMLNNSGLALESSRGALEKYPPGLRSLKERRAIHPTKNPRWLKRRSVLLSNIGDVLSKQGDSIGALICYHSALEAAQSALAYSADQSESDNQTPTSL
jgi:hypothetical protein